MSTPPSQAASTFVAACQQGKLPFPSTKARQQTLLKDAGVAEDISLSNADVKERAAALVWLRHAVANNIPPDTWSTLISPTLLANVRTLYPIPPAKSGADPAETDLHRLAKVVSLYMPDVPTSSTTLIPGWWHQYPTPSCLLGRIFRSAVVVVDVAAGVPSCPTRTCGGREA